MTERTRRSSPATVASAKLRVRLSIDELEDRVVPSFFPSTTNSIAIFEDQYPDGLSNAMIQFLATHTDGTQKILLDETQAFQAINPNFTVLQYQLGTGNSPYDYIINNQWSSDWNYVNSQESWFAHQTYSGEPQSASDLTSGRVGNSSGWEQADISNPAWQQYTLSQVLQNIAATGSDGWFADSFTYGIGGAGYDGTVPLRFQGTNAANPAYWPNGDTWTDQLAAWSQVIENAFAQYNQANGTNYQFIPNLGQLVTSWMPSFYDNASGVPFIDGAFLEGFGEYTDTPDWVLSMNNGLNFTDNNKIIIMEPYPSASPDTAAGQQQVDFFLGTYLLLKGSETYLNIQYGGGPQYYPQYEIDLGAPTTPLPSNVSSYLWDGVYRRDFQNGFVIVNPGSTSYTLNLGGNYEEVTGSGGGELTDSQINALGEYTGGSLSYKTVSKVTIAGSSAMIFLNTPLTVKTGAKSSANPVTGTSVNLSVLGAMDGGANGLTYTWTSSGPAGVAFSNNGDATANKTTATFTQAGVYIFTAAISAGTQSVTSTVKVTVNQKLTSFEVSPGTATVTEGLTQQFSATAYDQFGQPLAKQPKADWSIVKGGIGTVSATGAYHAPANRTGAATIRAYLGAIGGSTSVTVEENSPDVLLSSSTPVEVTGAADDSSRRAGVKIDPRITLLQLMETLVTLHPRSSN